MRAAPSVLKLTEDVLALHDGIREVLILEERAGQHVIVEEATRQGAARSLSARLDELSGGVSLAPNIILGASEQFGGEPGGLKLVGMLYKKNGVVLCNLTEFRVLAISTSPESFYMVMEVMSKSLPRLVEESELHVKEGAVRSAAVAEDIARFFLEGKIHGPLYLSIDDVAHRAINRRWEVHGTYRTPRAITSKRFQIEIDAENGSVMRFSSTSSISTLFFVELAALIGAAGLLFWMLFVNFLK
jgi:hypothetical protein